MEWGIDEAYGRDPAGRLHGCATCCVTWFGTDNHCWACGCTDEGPAVAVPPNGSESWSAARCLEAADDEETAAVLRRVSATP